MAASTASCAVRMGAIAMAPAAVCRPTNSMGDGSLRTQPALVPSALFGRALFVNKGKAVRTRSVKLCESTSVPSCQIREANNLSTSGRESNEGSSPALPSTTGRNQAEEGSRKSKQGLRPIAPGRRQLLLGGAALAAAVCCPMCGPAGGGSAQAADWAYGVLSGPPSWGGMCSEGLGQSPIDVPMRSAAVASSPLGNIRFFYEPTISSFLNTGHGTMQVNFPKGTNYTKIGDRTLELVQFHFHAPSEHSFNGTRTAMEAHLVHREPGTGKLAVVGVMMEGVPSAPPNPCLEAAIAFAPEEHGLQSAAPFECYISTNPPQRTCTQIQISPMGLLPRADLKDGGRSYIHYQGSLTTPPCSEGVDWFLMASSIRIPDAQVVEFMRFVGDRQTLSLNSRPVQDLGDRMLFIGP